MKKLNLFFAIAFLSLITFVSAAAQDYVITETGVKYYEKVRYGLTTGLVGVEESGRVKYKSDEVIAFRKDGSIYERMPVIQNNQATGRHTFMELIAYRNGLKVFRCNADQMQDEFIVYRDGNYVVKFDEKNSPTLNEFFFRSGTLVAGK